MKNGLVIELLKILFLIMLQFLIVTALCIDIIVNNMMAFIRRNVRTKFHCEKSQINILKRSHV